MCGVSADFTYDANHMGLLHLTRIIHSRINIPIKFMHMLYVYALYCLKSKHS